MTRNFTLRISFDDAGYLPGHAALIKAALMLLNEFPSAHKVEARDETRCLAQTLYSWPGPKDAPFSR